MFIRYQFQIFSFHYTVADFLKLKALMIAMLTATAEIPLGVLIVRVLTATMELVFSVRILMNAKIVCSAAVMMTLLVLTFRLVTIAHVKKDLSFSPTIFSDTSDFV